MFNFLNNVTSINCFYEFATLSDYLFWQAGMKCIVDRRHTEPARAAKAWYTGSQHRVQSTQLKPQHTVYGPASQTAKRSTVYSNRRHDQTACGQLV